jgi:RNA polymerase sigma factor (sigma-70 family)
MPFAWNAMPAVSDEFAALLLRARAGDRSALTHLAAQYEPEVRIVARVLLGQALRPYLDSLDLVQSVHKSLLMGLRGNKFDISSPEKLVALALTVVRRKVARHWRRVQRQQRLDGDTGSADRRTPVSSEPDPARDAQMQDAVHHLWTKLDAAEREMIELRLQGHSTVEVARILGLDADVLRVRLSRLRQRLRASGALSEWL